MTTYDVVMPLSAQGEFPALKDVRGWRTLQRGLKCRPEDIGAYLVRAWAPPQVSKSPYYLTSNASLWLNGLDGQTWFHCSFSLFDSEAAAVAGANHLRARDWELLELVRAELDDGKICLLPVPRIGA